MGKAKQSCGRGEEKVQKIVMPPLFADIHAEGKGAWRIQAWRLEDLPDDLTRRAFRHFVEMSAKAQQPPRCLICSNVTPREPHAAAFVSGHCDNPNQMIVLALSDSCAVKPHDVLLDEVTDYFLKALPGIVRKVEIHPLSGRA